MSSFSKNALTVLKKRYLLRDNKGKIVETPDYLLCRASAKLYKLADGISLIRKVKHIFVKGVPARKGIEY